MNPATLQIVSRKIEKGGLLISEGCTLGSEQIFADFE